MYVKGSIVAGDHVAQVAFNTGLAVLKETCIR